MFSTNFNLRWLVQRIFTVLIIAFLGAVLLSCGSDKKELILLHTNDSHGSILPVDSLGGMAERATFIRLVREQHPAVLLVDAGDINTGQAVSNMFDARPDIDAYNYMEYDAVTLGNHEFDKPIAVLLAQMKQAVFPFIASNVAYQGKKLGKDYLVKKIDGIKVGIFGLTTTNTANVSINAKEVSFEDEVKAAKQVVKLLKDQEVDIIIGLTHLGFTETYPGYITSYTLAREVEGIDILVDGHSHSYIEEPEKVNHTWVVTANQSGRYVGEGKITLKDGHIEEFKWKPVQIKGFRPDTILRARLRPYMEAADRDLQTVIGKSEKEFVLFQDGENMARYEENALGNLIADALKWKAAELQLRPDFALTNSGGIRENLPAGKITKGDVLAVLPFDNELEVVSLKGSDVRRLFDFLATVPAGNGAFAQVSKEVKVVYDRHNKKVQQLTINGQPVEDDRVYYMATCDYVGAGKDGYDAGLGNVINHETTSRLLSDVLMDYIRSQERISPETGQRIRFTD